MALDREELFRSAQNSARRRRTAGYLKLYVPDVQIRNLGPITISADVAGHELPARTFSQSNEYTYSATFPPKRCDPAIVVVNFRLDKSSVGLNGDARELGVVVTEVESGSHRPRRNRTFRPAAGIIGQQQDSCRNRPRCAVRLRRPRHRGTGSESENRDPGCSGSLEPNLESLHR